MDEQGKTTGLGALMERYLDGDRKAFRALLRALEPRLRHRIQSLVGSGDADDVLQATWMKAHLSRHRFQWQLGSRDLTVLGWYLAIARNSAIDHLRSRTRHRKRLIALDPSVEMPTAASVEPELDTESRIIALEIAEARRQRVRDAIDALPEGQRVVIASNKLEGIPIEVLAGRMGMRTGSLRVRAHRGYRRLQHMLSDLALNPAEAAA